MPREKRPAARCSKQQQIKGNSNLRFPSNTARCHDTICTLSLHNQPWGGSAWHAASLSRVLFRVHLLSQTHLLAHAAQAGEGARVLLVIEHHDNAFDVAELAHDGRHVVGLRGARRHALDHHLMAAREGEDGEGA